MTRLLFAFFAFVTLTHQIAFADLVITVGNFDSNERTTTPLFEAGNVVTLGLYIHNSSSVDLSAETFTLGFDLALPGSIDFYDGHNPSEWENFFSNFSLSPIAIDDGVIAIDVASSLDPVLGFDISIDMNATDLLFARNGNQNTALHIANISFESALNTPNSTFGFKFNPNASLPDDQPFNFVTGDLALAAGLDGSSFNRFSISAVPEPSSLALGASVLFVLGSIRRFRRKDPDNQILV